MPPIPSFPYSILWGERQVVSVANLTRQDALEFLELAPKVPVKTATLVFPLEQANAALSALREGKLEGAAVLAPSHLALHRLLLLYYNGRLPRLVRHAVV